MDKKQQNVEDVILGYLGMTKQDLLDLAEEAESVFVYAAGEPDDEERGEDEGPDLDSTEDCQDDCEVSVDTYVSQVDMLSSAVDNTLGKLVIGTLQFENGREMLDTVNAVNLLQQIKHQ